MRTLRCKCGERTAWTTDNFQDCQGCPKCNTTYAGHPDGHKELQPHIWGIKYNENTGKPYMRCTKCYEIDKESYKSASKVSDDIIFEIPPDDKITDNGELVDVPKIDEVSIPKNLEEAINLLTTNENKEFVKDKTEKEFLSYLHHGFGTGLRNGWGLWTGSILAKWFNEKGVYHADDMSSIILTSIYRVFNNKEIDLEGQIKYYRDYWEETNPDVNKGIM
jgi:hypothetical protein